MSTKMSRPLTPEIAARRPEPTPAPPPKKGTYLEGYNAGLKAMLDEREKALLRAEAAEREVNRLEAVIAASAATSNKGDPS